MFFRSREYFHPPARKSKPACDFQLRRARRNWLVAWVSLSNSKEVLEYNRLKIANWITNYDNSCWADWKSDM